MGATFTQLYVHLVWATRARTPWIVPSVARRLHGHLGIRCSLARCTAVAVGGVEDHVHVLVGLHPSVAVSDLVRDLKATSSAFLRHECAVDGFAWQEGYSAFTLRATELDTVRNYILRQREHHGARQVVAAWEP